METIKIFHANQGNLKDVSLSIPKNQLIAITGVSGSGKSTLAIDVLFQECQRQYLEALGMQGIQKPDVEKISHVSPAILINQDENNQNPRSTVGTLSHMYSDLRVIFEKLHTRTCPFCHEVIHASECKEIVTKKGQDFIVTMICSHCGHEMKKLTRTEFSFNTKEGACQTCFGYGQVLEPDYSKIFHEELTLKEGAVDDWKFRYKEYQIERYEACLKELNMPTSENLALKDFSVQQKDILLYGVKSKESKTSFEGVIPILWRKMEEKKDISNVYFKKTTCLTCQGERLNELSRQANVHGTRLSECSGMSLVELYDWLIHLEQSLSALEKSLVEVFLIDLKTKISRLMQVGLGYLTLDRPFMSCSGGEKQRFRCAAALDSDLSGVIYILDEPTKGLHPKDTQGLFAIIERLKAKGNTVIMIEHDVDIIKQADWIIELGPQAGRLGGQICEQGKTIELLNHQNSRLVSLLQHPIPLTSKHRLAHEYLSIKDAHTHNLKHLDIELPLQCLVGVCGVSGSGKSTLIFEELLRQSTLPMIPIRQTSINRMKRSNVATYCDVYSEIRKVFAELEKAKKLQLTAKHFSFNTSGGRCENCEGLGSVVNHLLFFKDTETTCPVCHGKQFKDEVLSVTYENYSIHDILLMSVSECKVVMGHFPKIKQILELLEEVGLGYLQLGQSLTTLSGGEGQRLKLAKELLKQKKTKNIYLIDEPTSGLHVDDITHLLILLQKLVDQGNSVILVEHNTQCLKACDYLIELGPGGGIDGGECIAFGTIDEVMANPHSITAPYLRYEERRE